MQWQNHVGFEPWRVLHAVECQHGGVAYRIEILCPDMSLPQTANNNMSRNDDNNVQTFYTMLSTPRPL